MGLISKLVCSSAVVFSAVAGGLSLCPGGIPRLTTPVRGSLLEAAFNDRKTAAGAHAYIDSFAVFVNDTEFGSEKPTGPRLARAFFENDVMKLEQFLWRTAEGESTIIRNGGNESTCAGRQEYTRKVRELQFQEGDRVGPFVVTQLRDNEILLSAHFLGAESKTWMTAVSHQPIVHQHGAEHEPPLKLMFGSSLFVPKDAAGPLFPLLFPLSVGFHRIYSRLIFSATLRQLKPGNEGGLAI